MSDSDKIKVSWDDLKDPKVDKELNRQQQVQPQVFAPALAPGGKSYPPPRQYGSIAPGIPAPATGRSMLTTPQYTGLAGLVGALIGWAITELVLSDSARGSQEDALIHTAIWFGLFGAAVGGAIGAVEGIMSRASDKALKGGAIGLAVGVDRLRHRRLCRAEDLHSHPAVQRRYLHRFRHVGASHRVGSGRQFSRFGTRHGHGFGEENAQWAARRPGRRIGRRPSL